MGKGLQQAALSVIVYFVLKITSHAFVARCPLNRKNHKVVPISEIIAITWLVDMSVTTPTASCPGHLWEALWNTQTLAYFVVTTAHLTMAWEIQHFGVHSMYPNCSRVIGIQWQRHSW